MLERIAQHRSQRESLVSAGAIPQLIPLLRSPSEKAQYRALKAVAHLGKHVPYRTMIVEQMAIPALVLLCMVNDRKVQTMATGTLANLSADGMRTEREGEGNFLQWVFVLLLLSALVVDAHMNLSRRIACGAPGARWRLRPRALADAVRAAGGGAGQRGHDARQRLPLPYVSPLSGRPKASSSP